MLYVIKEEKPKDKNYVDVNEYSDKEIYNYI